MDDLIYRKALRRKVQKVAVEAWKLKMTASVETVMNQFLDFLEQAPSVPAVPLDKLCEWLANSFSDPPCCALENVRCKMECRGFTQMDYSECWKHVLTKWMEGLDAETETST